MIYVAIAEAVYRHDIIAVSESLETCQELVRSAFTSVPPPRVLREHNAMGIGEKLDDHHDIVILKCPLDTLLLEDAEEVGRMTNGFFDWKWGRHPENEP